jgi:hypothetical protein
MGHYFIALAALVGFIKPQLLANPVILISYFILWVVAEGLYGYREGKNTVELESLPHNFVLVLHKLRIAKSGDIAPEHLIKVRTSTYLFFLLKSGLVRKK